MTLYNFPLIHILLLFIMLSTFSGKRIILFQQFLNFKFFEEMAFSTPSKEALRNTSRLNFDEVSPKHSIIMVVLILLLGSDVHRVHLS